MSSSEGRLRTPPDFVIPGAPRSGTTFLYEYLAQHPQIYMSPVKEPNFFATDLDSGSYMDSATFMRERADYLALYSAARPDQLTGEASTWYLYSRDAAANIGRNNPQTRIVIMLREPVAMLHSLHLRRIYGGSETIEHFEDALAAEEDRAAGRRIPPVARNIKAFQYHAVGSYAEQVRRYLDVFGAEQVRVVIFEEFRADPAAAYRGVLEHLGVDPEFKPEFKVVNASVSRRSPRMQRVLMSPRGLKAARALVPERMRPLVARSWNRLSSRSEKPRAMAPEVKRRLRDDLQPDIDRLGEILGRDLNEVWPRP